MSGLYRVATIRILEAALRVALPPGEAMRRAGHAAAGHAQRIAGSRRRVLVLAGPGDNGGDGAVCASVLAQRGFDVTIVGGPSPGPPRGASRTGADVGTDRRRAWDAVPGSVRRLDEPHQAPAPQLIVDALFGIGLSRSIGAPHAGWTAWANACDARRIALDVPSGLDADTGQPTGDRHGRTPAVFQAHETVTFVADKPGLHTGAAPNHVGCVRVETLGADPAARAPDGRLVAPAEFPATLRALVRVASTHKGRHGTIALVGGAPGMAGALLLAARAALKTGGGRVRAGFAGPAPLAVDPLHPELMLTDAQAAITQAPTVVAIGPGLGHGPAAVAALRHAVGAAVPLVLDADALNLLAERAALRQSCRQRPAPTVITPHPLEAARLLASDTATVQHDRIAAACALARLFGAITVLKGAGSIVAAPDGRWWINPTGSPALATGGTGDVLTGVIASLVGQSALSSACASLELDAPAGNDAALQATLAAVWLHGAAGEAAARVAASDSGVTAGELIEPLRMLMGVQVARIRTDGTTPGRDGCAR